jgi:hypothetical protein
LRKHTNAIGNGKRWNIEITPSIYIDNGVAIRDTCIQSFLHSTKGTLKGSVTALLSQGNVNKAVGLFLFRVSERFCILLNDGLCISLSIDSNIRIAENGFP